MLFWLPQIVKEYSDQLCICGVIIKCLMYHGLISPAPWRFVNLRFDPGHFISALSNAHLKKKKNQIPRISYFIIICVRESILKCSVQINGTIRLLLLSPNSCHTTQLLFWQYLPQNMNEQKYPALEQSLLSVCHLITAAANGYWLLAN